MTSRSGGEKPPAMKDGFLKRAAVISACGSYRYSLAREWSEAPLLPFVMLNPSTADEVSDDPTIRRCVGFARREGFGGIIVANVFAYRTNSPRTLLTTVRRNGPKNWAALCKLAQLAKATGGPVICAWGSHAGRHGDRVAELLRDHGARLSCLGKTKVGHPRHPLYVRADQPFEAFP